METIVLKINGHKVTCPSDASLLLAARQNGINIPTLCYHPDLAPHGACRLCLVEDEKTGRLMAACVTPATAGMSIQTDTPRILNHRRNIVRLMMAEHPESCIVCSKGNRCELRKIAADLGVGDSGLYPMPNYTPYEEINPFIIRDLSKCILCGKCIRADHELVVTGAIDYNHRGFSARPATLHEKSLEDSICTFCGTCVSICPTGALSVKNTAYVGTPEKEANSICGFCGVGCSLTMGVSGGRIVEVNPTKRKISVNSATLCVRGHFANDFINSPDRLVHPMKTTAMTDPDSASPENNESHLPISWDEAFETIANRLSEIKRQYGPESIAFVGSPRCSNEENFLFQKIARDVFETSHVITSGYTSGHRLLAHIDERTRGAARVTTLAGLESAEVIFVVCADLDNMVPVAGYHVRRAAKKGTALIVADAFKTDLFSHAAINLQPQLNGAGVPPMSDLINAVAHAIVAEKGQGSDFINQYTDGRDGYVASLGDFDAQAIEVRYALASGIFEQVAGLVRGRKIAFVIGPDLLDFPDGEPLLDAVINLVLLTGSIGAPGAGIWVPSSENNLVGAMDMGMNSDYLPGRKKIHAKKEATLIMKSGMSDLVAAMETGALRAAFVMGENPLRSLPQTDRVKAAFQNLEFLVVQDIVCNRTAELAHVILPGAAVFEKHGSFTNMEGRIQTFEPAVMPPGDAKADWEILAHLAKVMGYPEQYEKIEKIRQEIRRTVPMYQGLGNHQQDWIRNSESDNPFLNDQAKFQFLPAKQAMPVSTDPSFPLFAKIRSPRFHLGSGTRTSRSARIKAYNGQGPVELSPADCKGLGLADDEQVRIASAAGALDRRLKQNRHLNPGQVIIPSGVNGNDAMFLAPLVGKEDPVTFGFSFSRVRIEKISEN